MNRLPPEILSKIFTLINNKCGSGESYEEGIATPVGTFAHVSRQWQHLIEPITFRELHFTANKLPVAENGNYLTPRRLSHVRKVYVDFTLPVHSQAGLTDVDDERDDETVFNGLVKQLFGVLARIPHRGEPCVVLEISIPSLRYLPTQTFMQIMLGEESSPIGTKCLELDQDWNLLPDLPMIAEFASEMDSEMVFFDPYSISRLTSKMTRLKKVMWLLSDAEKEDADLRVRRRTDLAQSLETLPRTVEEFNLYLKREPPKDQSFNPPSIIPLHSVEDILSRELRRLSQRDGMHVFRAAGSIDSTIFWPAEPSDDPTVWPTLETFEIDFLEVLPSGEWTVMEDTEEPYEDLEDPPATGINIPGEEFANQIRFCLDDQVINRFSLAAARCARCMPKVKAVTLRPMNWPRGGIGFRNQPDSPRACLMMTGEPYTPKPTQEVLDAWLQVTKAHGLKFDPYIGNNVDKMPRC
ncbi:hypothetical protein F66182_1510 [Fusarium sp. NRRL 66182]|nr:hypothetical protein F66182_1510 [Fusarium sp. NRRL 66182]